MAISPYLSRKIKVLSFLAIYMVLVIHSAMPQASNFVRFDFFQRFMGDYMNRSYLALFMSISGYLFYQNISNSLKEIWITKYKSRFKSLFIPYFIWNILFLAQMAVLQYNPITAPWITDGIKPFISSGSVLQSIWMIFTHPANLPLWFIRNLMIIVIFAPVIYSVIKANYHIILLILLAMLGWKFQFAFCLLFFVIGGLIAIKKINIEFKIKSYWVGILILLSIFIGVFLTLKGPITSLNFYLAVIPLLALWFGYDYLNEKGFYFRFLNKILPYTFFIYVFHMPAINIFKKILVLIGSKCELSYWGAYIASPVLMILLAYFVASILKKLMPIAYSVMVGSRK